MMGMMGLPMVYRTPAPQLAAVMDEKDQMTDTSDHLERTASAPPTETYVVFLLGYPAVGKRTVGDEVAKRLDGVLVDNALAFYPIFKLFKWDGKFPLPPGTLQRADPIREAILQTIEEIAPASFSYVFTNCLEDTPYGRAQYERVRSMAARRGSRFLAVMLACDINEQVRRIDTPDRIARLKGSDPEGYRQYTLKTTLFTPSPGELLVLDTTATPPGATAESIVRELRTREWQ